MSASDTAYVLDTSAWLALIEDEDGTDRVQNILERVSSGSVQIFVSFMSFMEVFYITLQERDIEEAETRLRLMESLPITRVESTIALSITAGSLKARYCRSQMRGLRLWRKTETLFWSIKIPSSSSWKMRLKS